MLRRLLVGLLLVAGCRSPGPPRPSPTKAFASADGLHWEVRDGRPELAGDERPLPNMTLADCLRRTTGDDLGPDRPARVELTVASFTQSTRRRAMGGPGGGYSPVFMQKDANLGPSSGGGGAGFWLGLLGVVEVLWATAYTGWATVAAVDQERAEQSGTDPGVTCRLAGTAVVMWADGRRAEIPIDAIGQCDRGKDEKSWGPAVQAAQRQVADAVWGHVWRAVRPEPPPPPPPAPAAVIPTGPATVAPAWPPPKSPKFEPPKSVPPKPPGFAVPFPWEKPHVPVRPPAGAAPPDPPAWAGRRGLVGP